MIRELALAATVPLYTLTLAAALPLAASTAGAQTCNSCVPDLCQTIPNGPLHPCNAGITPAQDLWDRAEWWKSCTLSRKCSDWVRAGQERFWHFQVDNLTEDECKARLVRETTNAAECSP